jgi:plasmid stabilization system protein ParE
MTAPRHTAASSSGCPQAQPVAPQMLVPSKSSRSGHDRTATSDSKREDFDMSGFLDHAKEAREHLDEALGHLAEDRPRSAKRRVELARASIGRALEAHPEYVEPTHDLDGQGGAQTSDGREPRNASDAAIVTRLLGSIRAGTQGVKR